MERKSVGIVGAGQLGRMLALAGYPLGVTCRLLDRTTDAPGGQVADLVLGELDDPAALATLAASVDVLTLEIENVAVAALQTVDRVPVYPPPAAVHAAQDRLIEKELFRSLGIATADYVPVADDADLGAAEALGWPVVLKSRRMGYDGRGQRIARSVDELAAAWNDLGRVPAIAEAWVAFDRELSLIGAQGANAERVFYPLAENQHRDGILRATVAPYVDDELEQQAQDYLARIMAALDYRGVLTVEFFHARGGLIANEMAPRVHNSGHWTIEGAETSQFENHLRAVLDWPLGSTRVRGHAAMVNLLGSLPRTETVLGMEGVHFHDYGKAPRPHRKVGHCTLVDGDRSRLLARLTALRAALEVPSP